MTKAFEAVERLEIKHPGYPWITMESTSTLSSHIPGFWKLQSNNFSSNLLSPSCSAPIIKTVKYHRQGPLLSQTVSITAKFSNCSPLLPLELLSVIIICIFSFPGYLTTTYWPAPSLFFSPSAVRQATRKTQTGFSPPTIRKNSTAFSALLRAHL